MSSRHYKSISGDDITIDISAIGHSRGDDKTNVINHNNRNPLTVTQSRIFLVSLAMNVMLLFVIFYERGWSQQVVIDCNVQLDSASEELKFAAELSANPILLKCPAQDCDCASKGEEVNDNEMSIATLTEDAVYESEAYQKVTGQWKHYAADMEKELKRISTELLVEKFGLPPYFVQVNLEFPSSSDSNSGSNGGDGGNSEADEVDTMSSTIVPSSSPGGNSGSILIEMAPIELVPYTVLFFLTQVSSEAWDGCSFFINLGHVVSADIRGAPECRRERFRHLPGVGEYVAFHEYSSDFPHMAMTVGFPGMASGGPAGDSFYFSLRNNTAMNGPRGKRPVGAIPKDVDPCFGKVVAGFDVVKRLSRVPVKGGDFEKNLFRELVSIKKINVVAADKAGIIIANDNSAFENEAGARGSGEGEGEGETVMTAADANAKAVSSTSTSTVDGSESGNE